MQSRDDRQNILDLQQIDLSKASELVSKIKAAEEKGATSHVIGKMLAKGEVVDIRGLSYRVEFSDFVKGKYKVTLSLRDR